MSQPQNDQGQFSPLVGPQQSLSEITIKGLILGICLLCF